MPGSGRRYQFIDRTPVTFAVPAVLFAANIFVTLALTFLAKYLFSKCTPSSLHCAALASDGIQYSVPEFIVWYASWSDTISLVLGALLVVVILIFRKKIQRVR
jgi:hypothetical protein